MRYVLLIYGDEKAWAGLSPEQQEQLGSEQFKKYSEYSQWLEAKGLFKAGDPLQSTDQATTVRIRDGKTATTDGPFAETKEQLGGYYVIEAENLDLAIEAAARCPGAETGSMEVRPIMDM
ncbi:MAG: YciI family protein [Actinobacteria bacterium]|nr:YciI family protein [Actinomycetota bacterium]